MNKEGWIALGIQVIVMALTVGACYATAIGKIQTLENRINARALDHDILIRLDQKVDVLMEEVKIIRIDLKEHLKEKR